MRMRSAFPGFLLAVAGSAALSAAACTRDATAPAVVEEQISTERKVQELQERYGWIGTYHTDGLAFVFEKLKENRGGFKGRDQACRLAAKAVKEFHRNARKGEVPLAFVDPSLASETCDLSDKPDKLSKNVIAGEPTLRTSELSPLAVSHLNQIQDAINSATTRAALLSALHSIQSAAVVNLSQSEAGAVVAAASVAISSMDYWEAKLDAWESFPGAIAIPYNRLAGAGIDVASGKTSHFTTPRWWTHPAIRTYLKIVGADTIGAMRVIYTTWALGPIGWDAAAAAGLWSSISMTLSLLF